MLGVFEPRRGWRLQGIVRWLVTHADLLEVVGMFAIASSMTMFEMLSEMVGAKEFFRQIAFSKFVVQCQMVFAIRPIRCRHIGELVAAKAAEIGRCRTQQRRLQQLRLMSLGAWLDANWEEGQRRVRRQGHT